MGMWFYGIYHVDRRTSDVSSLVGRPDSVACMHVIKHVILHLATLLLLRWPVLVVVQDLHVVKHVVLLGEIVGTLVLLFATRRPLVLTLDVNLPSRFIVLVAG